MLFFNRLFKIASSSQVKVWYQKTAILKVAVKNRIIRFYPTSRDVVAFLVLKRHMFKVERRALEIYDSFSHLEEVKEQRARNHEVLIEKRFEKKIKQMRKDVSETPHFVFFILCNFLVVG